MDMFLDASRLKLRFESGKGLCSAEDLWDLNLSTLDRMYGNMVKEARSDGEDSLLSSAGTSVAAKKLNLRIEIVKHVVETKLADKEARENQANRRLKKEKLMGVLSRKQDKALEELSEEDVQKLIDEI